MSLPGAGAEAAKRRLVQFFDAIDEMRVPTTAYALGVCLQLLAGGDSHKKNAIKHLKYRGPAKVNAYIDDLWGAAWDLQYLSDADDATLGTGRYGSTPAHACVVTKDHRFEWLRELALPDHIVQGRNAEIAVIKGNFTLPDASHEAFATQRIEQLTAAASASFYADSRAAVGAVLRSVKELEARLGAEPTDLGDWVHNEYTARH